MIYNEPATINIIGIYDLYDRITYYIIIILMIIICNMMIINIKYISNIRHNNKIELIWTIIPSIILWLIGIPSLR